MIFGNRLYELYGRTGIEQVKVLELEDWVVGVHRDLAVQSGQSLEEHLRSVLKQATLESQARFAQETETHLLSAKDKYGYLQSSLEIIREQRERL